MFKSLLWTKKKSHFICWKKKGKKEKRTYPINERRLNLLGFFSGSSLIRCIDLLLPPCDFRPVETAALSDFRLTIVASNLTSSSPTPPPPPPDFLTNRRFIDSLRARGLYSLTDRGLFTACTISVTELVAISFWRAATKLPKFNHIYSPDSSQIHILYIFLNCILSKEKVDATLNIS